MAGTKSMKGKPRTVKETGTTRKGSQMMEITEGALIVAEMIDVGCVRELDMSDH